VTTLLVLLFFAAILLILLDPQQFDVKVEGSATGNDTTSTTIAVREATRQNDLSSFANRHGGKTFVPTANHLSSPDTKGKGTIAITT
jgi:hypothetical protein